MLCRDANPADLPALARVHIAAWRAAYQGCMDPEFLRTLENEHALSRLRPAVDEQPPLVVVIECDDGVVGFCRFGAAQDADATAGTGEVFAINVAPTHWRRGFGAALLSKALARLALSGYEVCTLWVLEKNERARQFYSDQGFAPDGAMRTEAAGSDYPLPEVRYRRIIGV